MRRLRPLERAVLGAAVLVVVTGAGATAIRREPASLGDVRISRGELPTGYGPAEPDAVPEGPVDRCRPSAVLDAAGAAESASAVHRADSPLRDVSWSVLVFGSDDESARVMASLRSRLESCDAFDTRTADGTVRFEYAIKTLDDPIGGDSIYLASRTAESTPVPVQSHGYVARRGPVIVNLRVARLLQPSFPAGDTRLALCVVELLLDRATHDSDEVGCRGTESGSY